MKNIDESLKAQAEANTYEAIDSYAANMKIHALLNEINRIVPKWAEAESRLTAGLFEGPEFATKEKLERDARVLMGRVVEHGSLDERSFYAILALSKIPGFEMIRSAVSEIATRLKMHPNQVAALRAISRTGDLSAQNALDDLKKEGRITRENLLSSLGEGEAPIGIQNDREWKIIQ